VLSRQREILADVVKVVFQKYIKKYDLKENPLRNKEIVSQIRINRKL